MAPADSTPTPVHDTFTGANTDHSTGEIEDSSQIRPPRQVTYPRRRPANRRYFIGGSDARIIMGDDEAALLRLWREKRGEVEPEDLSGNLIVQLGATTEGLNRRWYERITHRMPIGWYIVAVCYATAVILLGWWPWSILLILLLFSSSSACNSARSIVRVKAVGSGVAGAADDAKTL